jgi:hypothetical protein
MEGSSVIALLTSASDAVSGQLQAPAALTPIPTEYEVHGKWDTVHTLAYTSLLQVALTFSFFMENKKKSTNLS